MALLNFPRAVRSAIGNRSSLEIFSSPLEFSRYTASASLVSLDSLVAIEGRYGVAAAVYTEGDVWWLFGRLA